MLASVFLDSPPSWIENLMFDMLQNKSQRVGSLFRSQRYLTPETIMYLYKGTIRPCMEYCSHIWGGAPQSGRLDLLDRVQRRLVNLIGHVLSSTLQPPSHRRVVASLSLFYKYYHGRCSHELPSLVPHRCLSVRLTRFSERLHQYAVFIPRCKGNFYQPAFCHALQGFKISLCRLLSVYLSLL